MSAHKTGLRPVPGDVEPGLTKYTTDSIPEYVFSSAEWQAPHDLYKKLDTAAAPETFCLYVAMKHAGQKYGAVLLTPPPAWEMPFVLDLSKVQFRVEEQDLRQFHSPSRGITYRSDPWDANTFRQYAKKSECNMSNMTPVDLERTFWKLAARKVEASQAAVTESADRNDLIVLKPETLDVCAHGSGFPAPSFRCPKSSTENAVATPAPGSSSPVSLPFTELPCQSEELRVQYSKDPWNLLNLAHAPGSALRLYPEDIPGVTVPSMQFGMRYSADFWISDCLPTIIYSHNCAASVAEPEARKDTTAKENYDGYKVWYIAPNYGQNALRLYIAQYLRSSHEGQFSTAAIPFLDPTDLRASGVPVFRAVQKPGQFLMVWPRSYRSSISLGFSCSEECILAPLETLHQYPEGDPTRGLAFAQVVILASARKNLKRTTAVAMRDALKGIVAAEILTRQTCNLVQVPLVLSRHLAQLPARVLEVPVDCSRGMLLAKWRPVSELRSSFHRLAAPVVSRDFSNDEAFLSQIQLLAGLPWLPCVRCQRSCFRGFAACAHDAQALCIDCFQVLRGDLCACSTRLYIYRFPLVALVRLLRIVERSLALLESEENSASSEKAAGERTLTGNSSPLSNNAPLASLLQNSGQLETVERLCAQPIEIDQAGPLNFPSSSSANALQRTKEEIARGLPSDLPIDTISFEEFERWISPSWRDERPSRFMSTGKAFPLSYDLRKAGPRDLIHRLSSRHLFCALSVRQTRLTFWNLPASCRFPQRDTLSVLPPSVTVSRDVNTKSRLSSKSGGDKSMAAASPHQLAPQSSNRTAPTSKVQTPSDQRIILQKDAVPRKDHHKRKRSPPIALESSRRRRLRRISSPETPDEDEASSSRNSQIVKNESSECMARRRNRRVPDIHQSRRLGVSKVQRSETAGETGSAGEIATGGPVANKEEYGGGSGNSDSSDGDALIKIRTRSSMQSVVGIKSARRRLAGQNPSAKDTSDDEFSTAGVSLNSPGQGGNNRSEAADPPYEGRRLRNRVVRIPNTGNDAKRKSSVSSSTGAPSLMQRRSLTASGFRLPSNEEPTSSAPQVKMKPVIQAAGVEELAEPIATIATGAQRVITQSSEENDDFLLHGNSESEKGTNGYSVGKSNILGKSSPSGPDNAVSYEQSAALAAQNELFDERQRSAQQGSAAGKCEMVKEESGQSLPNTADQSDNFTLQNSLAETALATIDPGDLDCLTKLLTANDSTESSTGDAASNSNLIHALSEAKIQEFLTLLIAASPDLADTFASTKTTVGVSVHSNERPTVETGSTKSNEENLGDTFLEESNVTEALSKTESPHYQNANDKQLHDEEPHGEQPHDEQPHDEQSHDEEPHDEQLHDEQPHDKEPHDEKSHDEKPHGEQLHDEQPHDKEPHDEEPQSAKCASQQKEKISEETVASSPSQSSEASQCTYTSFRRSNSSTSTVTPSTPPQAGVTLLDDDEAKDVLSLPPRDLSLSQVQVNHSTNDNSQQCSADKESVSKPGEQYLNPSEVALMKRHMTQQLSVNNQLSNPGHPQINEREQGIVLQSSSESDVVNPFIMYPGRSHLVASEEASASAVSNTIKPEVNKSSLTQNRHLANEVDVFNSFQTDKAASNREVKDITAVSTQISEAYPLNNITAVKHEDIADLQLELSVACVDYISKHCRIMLEQIEAMLQSEITLKANALRLLLSICGEGNAQDASLRASLVNKLETLDCQIGQLQESVAFLRVFSAFLPVFRGQVPSLSHFLSKNRTIALMAMEVMRLWSKRVPGSVPAFAASLETSRANSKNAVATPLISVESKATVSNFSQVKSSLNNTLLHPITEPLSSLSDPNSSAAQNMAHNYLHQMHSSSGVMMAPPVPPQFQSLRSTGNRQWVGYTNDEFIKPTRRRGGTTSSSNLSNKNRGDSNISSRNGRNQLSAAVRASRQAAHYELAQRQLQMQSLLTLVSPPGSGIQYTQNPNIPYAPKSGGVTGSKKGQEHTSAVSPSIPLDATFGRVGAPATRLSDTTALEDLSGSASFTSRLLLDESKDSLARINEGKPKAANDEMSSPGVEMDFVNAISAALNSQGRSEGDLGNILNKAGNFGTSQLSIVDQEALLAQMASLFQRDNNRHS